MENIDKINDFKNDSRDLVYSLIKGDSFEEKLPTILNFYDINLMTNKGIIDRETLIYFIKKNLLK